MEQRRFGESDHEPLEQDDILARAITGLRDELPSRDLWAGIATQIEQQPVVKSRQITFSVAQLAIAASLLIAVASGLTYLATTRAAATNPALATNEPVIQAYGTPDDQTGGQVVPANFADAQYNAAVTDLEKVLREDRGRLDPRTVQIIERNLQAIDDAINEARAALNNDPANPYLNSHLADARQRKLDLLRHATSLASAGGD
jgi:negative regulator of sigma E activity